MSRNRSLEEIQEDIRTLTRVPSEFIHAKLDELAEEIRELAKPKWIPYSEKMPEESGFYMASVYCEVTKESHCRSVWFTFDDDPYAEMEWRELPSYEKVVAWMPLLDPYKGE